MLVKIWLSVMTHDLHQTVFSEDLEARKQPIVPFLEEILEILHEAKQQIEFALELKMF